MGSAQTTCGYRLIHVNESSPAAKAGLCSYLDFIVSANGVALSPDQTLNTIISKSLNCKVTLQVFNVLTGLIRQVQVLPSNSWGGEGLLGASIRWEDWTLSEGLRVLEVVPDSHAHRIGLETKKDYILGNEATSINDVGTLEKIILSNKKTELFVFNSRTGKVRNIPIENCKSLGCTVGEGMMNSIKFIDLQAEEPPEEEKIVVTVLKKPNNDLVKGNIEVPKPPPASHVSLSKEKAKVIGTVGILPPPSIYDLSMENITFQPKVLLSKYILIT